MSSCDCCIEKFNKSTRAIVECPNAECDYNACRGCCQTYLLSQSNFGCMGCRTEWSFPHLTTQFTKTFLQGKGKFAESGGLRKHWENVIMNTEMAFFDATNRLILLQDIRTEYDNKRTLLWFEFDACNRILPEFKKERRLNCTCQVKKGVHKCFCKTKEEKTKWIQERNKLIDEVKKKQIEINLKLDDLRSKWRESQLSIGMASENKPQRKNFVQSCMKDGCDGFLSTAWKCRVCESHTCNKCMTIKEDGHECDPEIVKTIQMCIKETKPCPKCSERIHRIDGCDQMFCVQCETIFSWNTGEIQIGGWIHAPDAVRLMRERGFLRREVGDIPCGGVPTAREIMTLLKKVVYCEVSALPIEQQQDVIIEVWNIIKPIMNQLRAFEDRYVNNQRPEINRYNRNLELRQSYLRGHITKQDWKKRLFINEKDFLQRKDEELIKHGWYIAAADCIRNFLTMSAIDEIRAEVVNLLKLMNQFNEFFKKQIFQVYGKCYTQYTLFSQKNWRNPIKPNYLTKVDDLFVSGVWRPWYEINPDEIVWTPLTNFTKKQ